MKRYYHNDIGEPPISPPDGKEYKELDTSTEEIEVMLDAVVTVDANGYWEYDDETYPWAQSEYDEDDWYTEDFNVRLADKYDIVDAVNDEIVTYMPAVPGKYHISGKCKLFYEVDGIFVDEAYDEFDGGLYYEDVDTENAHVTLLRNKSQLTDFKFEEVR